MPIPALRPTLLGALTPALALLLGLVSPGAQALGLGRPVVHSTLGKPLDVSFPLLLAEGEVLSDSCVRAEVLAGDARVPAGLLLTRIEGERGQRRIRLQSEARIDEPALRITLALGCPLMLTREFSAFIDPVSAGASAPVAAPAPAPLPVYTPPPAPEAANVQLQAAAPAPVVKPKPRPKPRASGPRLTLDRPEILTAEAPRPAPPAASAPEMELTPELEAQIAQLEQTVAQLRAELLARQAAGGASPAEAASEPASAAEPASAPAVTASAPAPAPAAVALPVARTPAYRDPMTWLLTLAMSLIAGSAAFYFSRWRDQRARQELAYWRALHAAEGAAPPAPAPAPSPGIAPPVFADAVHLPEESQHQITRPQPRPMPWPPAQVALGPEFSNAMQATQPLPPRSETVPAPAAPVVTVADELLDLQQQVEFLVLLGQHDAAADLLATRLQKAPVIAMPYLMLMELCQQRGDAEVFSELARQFEHRFRTLAPQWEHSLSRGRSLDGCPSVIAHLQVVWADAEVAMRMLQQLLAEGGGPGTPQFDLPALRDLLTLYSVARDLFEAGMRSDEVDLMLPLDSSFGH